MMQNHHAAMYRRRVARSSCAVLAATGATLMQSAVSAVGRGQLTRGSSLSYHAHTHNAQAGGLLLLLHTFFPMGLATMSFAHSAAASIRPTVTPLVMGNCCRIGECGSCESASSHQWPRRSILPHSNQHCARHSHFYSTPLPPPCIPRNHARHGSVWHTKSAGIRTNYCRQAASRRLLGRFFPTRRPEAAVRHTRRAWHDSLSIKYAAPSMHDVGCMYCSIGFEGM